LVVDLVPEGFQGLVLSKRHPVYRLLTIDRHVILSILAWPVWRLMVRHLALSSEQPVNGNRVWRFTSRSQGTQSATFSPELLLLLVVILPEPRPGGLLEPVLKTRCSRMHSAQSLIMGLPVVVLVSILVVLALPWMLALPENVVVRRWGLLRKRKLLVLRIRVLKSYGQLLRGPQRLSPLTRDRHLVEQPLVQDIQSLRTGLSKVRDLACLIRHRQGPKSPSIPCQIC
jgi:hypothetical protein